MICISSIVVEAFSQHILYVSLCSFGGRIELLVFRRRIVLTCWHKVLLLSGKDEPWYDVVWRFSCKLLQSTLEDLLLLADKIDLLCWGSCLCAIFSYYLWLCTVHILTLQFLFCFSPFSNYSQKKWFSLSFWIVPVSICFLTHCLSPFDKREPVFATSKKYRWIDSNVTPKLFHV